MCTRVPLHGGENSPTGVSRSQAGPPWEPRASYTSSAHLQTDNGFVGCGPSHKCPKTSLSQHCLVPPTVPVRPSPPSPAAPPPPPPATDKHREKPQRAALSGRCQGHGSAVVTSQLTDESRREEKDQWVWISVSVALREGDPSQSRHSMVYRPQNPVPPNLAPNF